jgi:acyl-CoA synthetase (AMP-forming)/AMP-acid ligase II
MLAPDLITCLRQNASRYPDKSFLCIVGQRSTGTITFAELWERSCAAGAELAGRFERGRVCLVFLPQDLRMAGGFFGAMAGGLVPSFMPLPSAKQQKDLYWKSHLALIARIEPACIITDAAHAADMQANGITAPIVLADDLLASPPAPPPAAPEPSAVAFLQHSSGTTGLKKGVALSHAATLRQIDAYRTALATGPDDAIASWLPVYHDMGFIACTIMPLVLGQTVTLMDPFVWTMRPHMILDLIEESGAQFAWMPNFGFEHVARAVEKQKRTWRLDRLRAFINCSEPCKARTFDHFLAALAPSGLKPEQLQVCYAMAETVFAATQTSVGQPAARQMFNVTMLREQNRVVPVESGGEILLSAGRPVGDLAITIRRGDQNLPAGEAGEICLSGSFLFDGYYRLPEVTAERVHDGVYHSRDLGFMHEGELYVLGRTDDLIIVHGKNLLAHEVEGIVNGIEGLKPGRNVAFGVPNEEAGSLDLIVVAERLEDHPADGTHLLRQIKDRVFDHTAVTPADCAIVDASWLVKTTSGKISRIENMKKYINEFRNQRAHTNG